ncbi:hypothetical protein [Bacillus cereus]|uniref:hypothetical protein n=1 Tax=Bacillus cereus TaxID=1396 RepID=UPI0003150EB3|nr:hypothetical protein [Bacillus cereus]
MVTEVTLHSQAMLKIEDKDIQGVESKIFVQSCSSWLYNSELLTYSTAAHLVSALLNIIDIFTGLRLSKLLALISLNFPKEYVPLLKENNRFTLPRETKKAILETNDPSYIFYRLVRNIQLSKEDVSSADGEFDIEKILKTNGLPTQKQFEERVIKSMQAIRNNHVEGPYSKRMKASLEFGTSYFKDFGLNAYAVSPLHLIELAKKNALPIIFEASDLDDDKNIHVDRYFNISDIESRIGKFIKACGY